MSRQVVFQIFAAATGVAVAGAQAQENKCDSCLELVSTVALTTRNAPIVPSLVQSVLQTRDGRFLVSHLFTDATGFAVYSPSGEFMELYDRRGDGPGELRHPPRLHSGPGSEIWVVEGGRLVRLDAGLGHVDTRALRFPLTGSRSVVTPDGSIVINSRMPGPGASRFTVVMMDSAGTAMEGLERVSDAYTTTVIAPAEAGGFWALRTNQLLLRRYSDEGRLARSVLVASDHFEAWEGEPARAGLEGADFRPRPRHLGLFDVGDEQIVILTRVAGAEWAPLPSSQPHVPSEMDFNRQYDTMVSLVDLRSGQSVLTRRVSESLRVVDGSNDLLYSTARDDLGHVVTNVVRVSARRAR